MTPQVDELSEVQYLTSIWASLKRIESLLSTPSAPLALPPAPVVVMEPPDLSAIVTAVQGIRGGSVDASQIAAAIADVLSPLRNDDSTVALNQVAEALKTLDHRMQGFGRQAYGGGTVTLDNATQSGLAASISAGFPNGRRDHTNEQTALLGAGAQYTGTFQAINRDSALILLYAADQPITSLQVQWSDDGVNRLTGPFDTSTVTTSFLADFGVYGAIDVENIPLGKYYRVHVVNGATPQGFVTSVASIVGQSFSGLFQGPTGPITSLSTSLLTRAIITGMDPNGGFANEPATGVVTSNSTTTNLNGGAGFTGTFISTLGWSTIDVLINASHDSAVGGVQFQFSNDGAAIDRTVSYDYTAAAGGLFFTLPCEAEFVRLNYVNGGTTTTTLHIETILRVQAPGAVQAPLSAKVTRSQVASMVKNDPIPLTTAKASQDTVGTVSAQLACSTNPLAKRKSLSIKSHPGNANNNVIYITFASPATTGTGYALGNGDSVDLELGDTDDSGTNIGIYAVATNSGQILCYTEIA